MDKKIRLFGSDAISEYHTPAPPQIKFVSNHVHYHISAIAWEQAHFARELGKREQMSLFAGYMYIGYGIQNNLHFDMSIVL